jgi:acetyl esterase/lipase
VFSTIDTTKDIQFATNINNQGVSQDLKMDIYTPNGDTLSHRPLMILAFGGSFVTGNKRELYMKNICVRFAQMGYVTASIDYRIGIKNQFSLSDQASAVYRGTQDFKAAIRFFYKNHSTYKIDTSRIFSGGISAGAIAALHASYQQQNEVIATLVDTVTLNVLSNQGGNAGYSEKVRAIVNGFGAIIDSNWISKTNENIPIISVHGSADNVVPYKYNGFGSFGLYGSWSINKRLENQGIKTKLHTFWGGGHALLPTDTAKSDTMTWVIRDFLYELMQEDSNKVSSIKYYNQNSANICNYLIYISDNHLVVKDKKDISTIKSISVYNLQAKKILDVAYPTSAPIYLPTQADIYLIEVIDNQGNRIVKKLHR